MSKGITLVLGGLGVKGIANIGVLQALVEHKVNIKRIVAAGIGTLVGAQFALGRELEPMTEYFVRFFTENDHYLWGLEQFAGVVRSRKRRVVDSFNYFLRERLFCQANLKRISILPWELVEADIENVLGGASPMDLKMPLAVSAIDLKRKTEVLLEDGDLKERLKAGIAFPGLFPPVHIGNRELVSSTLYCEVPLGMVGRAKRPIVAVDIPSELSMHTPGSVIEIMAHMDEVRGIAIKEKLLSKADIILTLEGLRRFRWGSYKQIPQLISRARREMDRLLSSVDGPWKT
jgi:NTE family protein